MINIFGKKLNGKISSNINGFTFMETVVVVGLIGLIAAASFIGINPVKHFAEANNYIRLSHLTAIMNAVQQRRLENDGDLGGQFKANNITYNCPPLVENQLYYITTSTLNDDGLPIDLYCLTPYITALDNVPSGELPVDPNTPGAYWESRDFYDTKYTIKLHTNGTITVTAPGEEYKEGISINPTTQEVTYKDSVIVER